jgi:hypothetical protein
MVWKLSSIGGDYKIQKGVKDPIENTFGEYVDYLTIKSDGNIGINNSSPLHKLDIQGNSRVNGSFYTSNIIGNIQNTSNLLRINYLSNVTNQNNSNYLEIYGNTSFRGNVGIGVTNPLHSLDIIGNVKSTTFIGIGSNITNINTSNITDGVLPIVRGGLGIDRLNALQILVGGSNNNIEQYNEFTFDNLRGILKVANIQTSGEFINELNAGFINKGLLPVIHGGTGISSYNLPGGVLIGNIFGTNAGNITQSTILKWNNTNLSFNIGGDIRIPQGSNIYIGDELLSFDNFSEYASATSNIKGIIRFGTDFKINEDDRLVLASEGSSKWTASDSAIFYPSFQATVDHIVGIGGTPDNINKYRLDVKGDINTSNGVFKINGINVINDNSNIISNRINTFTLDNLGTPNTSNIGNLLNTATQNGGWNNKCFSLRQNTINSQSSEYFISSSPNNTYPFIFDQRVEIKGDLIVAGAFTLNNPEAYTEFSSIKLKRPHAESILIVEQIGTGSIARFSKGGNIECIINKNGNLGLGRNNLINFGENPLNNTIDPVEKLHVIGNIIATGRIISYYSDERLKTFSSNITNSLEIIDSLSGYRYTPNELAIKNGFKYENEIGLSAQQVQKVLPEIVKLAPFDTIKDDDGNNVSKSGNDYLTICYERLGAVFVEAIKELHIEIKKIKEENILLKEDIKNIKSTINNK